MCVCVCARIYVSIYLSLSICLSTYMYVYIYIYDILNPPTFVNCGQQEKPELRASVEISPVAALCSARTPEGPLPYDQHTMKAGEELPRPLKAALESLACFRAELASSQGQVLAKLDSELKKFHNLQPPTPAHEAGRSPILFLRCAFINKCCGLVVRPWESHAFCGQALGLLQPPPPLRASASQRSSTSSPPGQLSFVKQLKRRSSCSVVVVAVAVVVFRGSDTAPGPGTTGSSSSSSRRRGGSGSGSGSGGSSSSSSRSRSRSPSP